MTIDKALEFRIDQFFAANKDSIIKDIFNLVRIRSVSEAGGPPEAPFGIGCKEVLDTALELADSMGYETKNFNYYVGTASYGNKEKQIGLCTHLDVVPEGSDWIYSPYEPTIVENHLVGRGVSDDKGPAVLMMYVVKCIEELGIPMNCGIKMIMGCNEECGMKDLEYYVKQETPPAFTLVPDSIYPVNNGEKGRGVIELTRKGATGRLQEAWCGTRGEVTNERAYAILSGDIKDFDNIGDDFDVEEYINGYVKITAKGLACHGTKPETGISSINLLFKMLLEHNILEGAQKEVAEGVCHTLMDYNGEGLSIAYEDKESGKVTHLATKMDFSKGDCSINYTVVCPVTMSMEWLYSQVYDLASSLGFDVEKIDISNPIYVSPEEPVVKALMDVYIHVHTKYFPPIVTGGTYAKMLPNALAFGNAFRESRSPFTNGHGGIHKPDECILIDDLLESAKIYVLALIELDQII